MRARNIKPGFFKNDELAEIGPCAQLLFAGLWCMADKEGKLVDRAKRIKAEIFPYYDPKPGIEKILTALTAGNFITRYSVNGQKIIKIVNFLEHQSPHHTEKASNLPDLQEGSELTVNSPLDNGEYPPDSLIPDSLIPDSKASTKQVDKGNGFDEFWNAYPKKKAKPDALAAWKKSKNRPSLGKILAAIDRQKKSDDWTKENGQFIPYPATWINKGRWDDEVEMDIPNQFSGPCPKCKCKPCICGR